VGAYCIFLPKNLRIPKKNSTFAVGYVWILSKFGKLFVWILSDFNELFVWILSKQPSNWLKHNTLTQHV